MATNRMVDCKRQWLIGVIAGLLSLSAIGAGPELPDVAGLAHEDPAVRRRTADALIAAGSEARPRLLAAIRSDSPILRRSALNLLDRLPRDLPVDPPPVREILRDYGKAHPNVRRELIGKLIAIDPAQSRPVLWRLLATEPESEETWYIATVLMPEVKRPDADRLAQDDPALSTAPLAFVAGWALRYQDRSKSISFLNRALDANAIATFESVTKRRFIIQMLVEMDLRAHRFDKALPRIRELRRLWPMMEHVAGVEHDPGGRQLSAAAEVLIHHAKYGPFDGWPGDVLIALHHQWVYGGGGALPAAAALLERTRLAPLGRFYWFWTHSTPSDRHRWQAAEVLGRLNRDRDAARLFKRPNLHAQTIYETLAWFRYYRYSGELPQAIAASEKLINLIDDSLVFTSTSSALDLPRLIQGQAWRRGLIAGKVELYRQLGDLDQAKATLDQLRGPTGELLPNITDDDASDLLPTLRALQLNEEARTIFNHSFDQLKAKIQTEPDDPSLLNQAAWLCATAAMQLDQGEAWARRAVEIEPNDAGFIDTLALVLFERGQTHEAIELQRRAVELDPNFHELRVRLAQFEAARR